MSTVAGAGEATRPEDGAADDAPRAGLHTVRLQARGVVMWGAALGLYSAA